LFQPSREAAAPLPGSEGAQAIIGTATDRKVRDHSGILETSRNEFEDGDQAAVSSLTYQEKSRPAAAMPPI
jgi:hypothetical protein